MDVIFGWAVEYFVGRILHISSMKLLHFIIFVLVTPVVAYAQAKTDTIPLVNNRKLKDVNVLRTEEIYQGKPSVKVIDIGENTEVKFVRLDQLEFSNGVIEIDLAGKPAANASEQARGFVGIAFRIASDHSAFECIYLRPSNGRAEDQVRRNHSVQYISYPEYPWQRLRKEFPEKYESYVDLVPGEWTKVRIEVQGQKAKLYVHGHEQPVLIVQDLRLGADQKGAIGLWIGPGTEAHFANLRVTKN